MFAIDEDGGIQHTTQAVEGMAVFSTRAELTTLADARHWSKQAVTEIWNGFAGTAGFDDLKSQKCFKNRPYGLDAIWKAIQRLDPDQASQGPQEAQEAPIVPTVAVATEQGPPVDAPAIEPEAPVEATAPEPEEAVTIAPQQSAVAPAEVEPKHRASRKTRAPRATKAPKVEKAKAVKSERQPRKARTGTKKEEVIQLLRRKNGASIAEIQAITNWESHSARGFCFGSCKKAGLVVESWKTGDERRYRIIGQ